MLKMKMLALAMAASMAVSGISTSAYAGGTGELSFSQLLRKNWEQGLAETREQLEKTQESSDITHLGINLKLGETGKALLGMFAPVDVSWLETADIELDATKGEETAKAKFTVSVNGTAVATANLQTDQATSDFCLQIPEISESVITGNLAELAESMNAQTGVEETELTEEQEKEVMQIVQNLTKNPPEPDVIVNLMDRYMGILLEAYEDGEVEEGISYTINGITQEATSVEGVANTETIVGATRNLLAAAKDDQELLAILQTAVAGTSYEAGFAETYQSAMDEVLKELEAEPVSDDPEEQLPDMNISLKVLVDADEEVVGEEMTMGVSGAEQTVLNLKTAKDGDRTALDMVFSVPTDESGMETTEIALTGEGTTTDGVLNGEYRLSASGTPVATIAATQTADEEALKQGNFEGHYVITPIVETENMEEGEYSVMSAFEGFSLEADVKSSAEGGSLGLDVKMSGSSLAALNLSASKGPGVEFELDATNGFAVMDEDGMNQYMSTIDPTPVFTNLMSAGMPENFINDVMAAMSGETTDPYALDEEEGTAEAVAP